MAKGRKTEQAWARAAEKRTKLSAAAALDQVVNAVQANKLPPTALVPALKGSMSQAQLQKEFGITGTTNFRGDLLTESNVKLVHQQAFGQPGSRTWGEWEKILMTDPAVSTALEHVKLQIRDCEVDFVAADVDLFTDRKSAETQRDFAKWNLTSAMEPGWSELTSQLTNQLAFGFTLHELVAGQAKHPKLPGGTGYRLAKLAERLPVSVHPMGWVEDAETKDLQAVRQWGNYPGTGQWFETLIPASKLLLTSWARRGNNYLGFPAFRSVWWWCKAREQLAKLVPISLIREGAGVPTAYTEKPEASLDTKSRKRLEKFLANLVFHENANIVLPAGWKLDWFNSGASANKGHIVQVYNDIGTIILQQVMAQHLALGVHGNTGNRSLGETQSTISDAFIAGVLANIEGALNGVGERPYTGLIPKLVQWNWGPQPAYPQIKLTLKKTRMGAADYASALVGLKGGGCITVWTHEDENEAREHMGLRPVSEDDFQTEQDKRDEAAQQSLDIQKEAAKNQPPAPGSPQANAKGGTSPTKKPGAGGTLKKLAADGSYVPRRPLRPSEQYLALADIESFLDGSKESFERGARPLVAELLAKALPDVKQALADGDPGELADVELDTARLEAFIASYIDKCRAEGYRQVAAEARKAGVRAALAAGDEKAPAVDQGDDEDELLYEAMKKQASRAIEARLRAQLELEAIDVVRTGGKPSEVIGNVLADETESKALQASAGLLTTKAFNMGREEFADEYADSVESVELSSILDDGTCDYCDRMDGEEFDFQSDEHDEHTPPLRDCEGRDRCRCLLVYNFRS